MPRVTVLGAGLVGSLIARTLAADGWDVLACDRSEDALGALAELPRVATARLDFASGAAIAAAGPPGGRAGPPLEPPPPGSFAGGERRPPGRPPPPTSWWERCRGSSGTR